MSRSSPAPSHSRAVRGASVGRGGAELVGRLQHEGVGAVGERQQPRSSARPARSNTPASSSPMCAAPALPMSSKIVDYLLTGHADRPYCDRSATRCTPATRHDRARRHRLPPRRVHRRTCSCTSGTYACSLIRFSNWCEWVSPGRRQRSRNSRPTEPHPSVRACAIFGSEHERGRAVTPVASSPPPGSPVRSPAITTSVGRWAASASRKAPIAERAEPPRRTRRPNARGRARRGPRSRWSVEVRGLCSGEQQPLWHGWRREIGERVRAASTRGVVVSSS